MNLKTLCHKERAYDGRAVVRCVRRAVDHARSEGGVSCMTVSSRSGEVLDGFHHIWVVFHHSIER